MIVVIFDNFHCFITFGADVITKVDKIKWIVDVDILNQLVEH